MIDQAVVSRYLLLGIYLFAGAVLARPLFGGKQRGMVREKVSGHQLLRLSVWLIGLFILMAVVTPWQPT